MAKYEPPVTSPGTGGGTLRPPTPGGRPRPPQAGRPKPPPPGEKPRLTPPPLVDVAEQKRKKKADEELTWGDVSSAIKETPGVMGQMLLAAPGAMAGLAVGATQGPIPELTADGETPGWYGVARSIGNKLLPLIGVSKTTIELGGGIIKTLKGDNVKLAAQALKAGESPLPYVLEDVGNIAIVAGGSGLALKGGAAAAKTAGTKAALEAGSKQAFRVARMADNISDAPITLPAYGIGKGVKYGGRYGRSRANAARAEAAKLAATNPNDPKIATLRNSADKLDDFFGKEVFIDGIARTMTRKAMNKFTTRALRRTNAAADAIGRSMPKVVDEALYADQINPETGQPYGPLSDIEFQAVVAILNGRARLINELVPRLNKTPGEIADLGRYTYAPGAGLTPDGAELAVRFLNRQVDDITGQRLAAAAERLSRELESVTELAREGRGRRAPLAPMYDIPLPEPQRFAARLRQEGATGLADEIDELFAQGYYDELLAGDFNNPRAEDALQHLQSVLERAPDDVALDPAIYPPKERNNVAFYGRIREALRAQAAATAGGTPPGPGYPGGRPTPMEEGPATGIQPEEFYDSINAPGAFSRMPERYLRNSIKQLERLRGRARQIGEKIVQIEMSIRNLEFKIIKASLRIESLEGYYVDADGNRLVPDEQGMFPADAEFVPGLIANLIARRDAARAELEKMRTEQAQTTVVEGKVHTVEQIEQMVVEADEAVVAVEAAISELEAEVDTTVSQMAEMEKAQAEAANELEDLGENADALLEAAAIDADSVPGDPEAFLTPDDGSAAIAAARADVEAARAAQAAARNVELEARAKITDLEARYRNEQDEYAKAVAQEGQRPAGDVDVAGLTEDNVRAVIDDTEGKQLDPELAASLRDALDSKYVPPTQAQARSQLVTNIETAASGVGRVFAATAFGKRYASDGYVLIEITATSPLAKMLPQDGRYDIDWGTFAVKTVNKNGNPFIGATINGVSYTIERIEVGKNAKGKPSYNYRLGNKTYKTLAEAKRSLPLNRASEDVPNLGGLLMQAVESVGDAPAATPIGRGNAGPGGFAVVVFENADGTKAGYTEQILKGVLQAGDTLHFTDPNKPAVIRRKGETIGIIMPVRGGGETPVGLQSVVARLPQEVAAMLPTKPKLVGGKRPKRPTITPDDLDAATAEWNDAQEAVRVADQALREAEGQLYAVEQAAPAARLTPPREIGPDIGEPGARPWDFVEATPEQTMVDQELPVFKKKYGKDKTIYVRVNAEGNTVILFDGYRKKNFAYADNGFELTLQPGATVADALQAMDQMRYFIDDETPVIFYGSGGVSQNRLASFRANRAGEKSPTALRAQKQMREAFNDLYAALQSGELPVRPAAPLLSAPRAARLDAQGRAAEAAANIEVARAEDGDVAAAVAEYDAAVAEAQALEAGVEVGPIEAAAAPPPPETVSTTAATEFDWQKQSDGTYTINTGSRRYAALKVDVTPPGAKRKRTTWALKRYGSDGEVIEGSTQVFPTFKAAREYVQSQIEADALYSGQRYIYRPGRELGPGTGTEVPVSLLAAEQRLQRAEAAVGSAEQRLQNLRTQIEKNTARIDKLRVDEAAQRAKLAPITAAAVRTEARLGPEIYTQPDMAQFAGGLRGVPAVGQALSETGVPVLPGEGLPAMLRPTMQTRRRVDEQIRAINEQEATRGVPVEQRTREVVLVESAANQALLRRRDSLPPALPARVALGAEREIAQQFIGSQYIPVGRSVGRARGARMTVEQGLTGDLLLRSERRRSGMGEEIYDIVELARVLAAERRQMELNEAYRVLLNSQFAVSPEELLGADAVRALEQEAYDLAWRDAPEGWAAYAPGVPNRDAVFDRTRREILGSLLYEEMRNRGFETIPPDGRIDSPMDFTVLDGSTKFLPTYAKERIMEKRSVRGGWVADKYLSGTGRVTSAFKNITLPLSIIWQIGDLVGIIWAASATGVAPTTMATYMVDMLKQNYGGPDATRMDVLRNIFKDPQDRRIGELADLLAASGIQDTGLRIQESRRLRGEDPGAEPQTVPQRLLNRFTPDLPRPTLAGGRLGITRGNIGNLFPAYRQGAYRVNEAINRVGRHAYFLAKLGEEINKLNLRDGTNYTIDDLVNMRLHERPGPIREAWEDAIDTANEVMGDWLDLTPFERRVVLPHLTFYAWTKHIHKLFVKIAKENPSAIKWQMYLGALAYDPDSDPLELYSSYVPTPGGGLAGTNFLNSLGDVVEGPIGSLVLQQDPSRLFTGTSPLPRILVAGLTGRNLAKGLQPISRQYGTGDVTRTGQPKDLMLATRPTELLGFAAQQFPIGTKLLDILPSGQLPGTSIQTGPFERYDTGQARFKPMTSRPVPKFGGRLLTAARLLTLPGVPTTSIEKMRDIERRAQQRLRAFETAKRTAEARND